MSLCVSLISKKTNTFFVYGLFVALFSGTCFSLSGQSAAVDSFVVANKKHNKVLIEGITVSGNIKTKNKIILRELTVSAGEEITLNELKARLERSKQNLINTSLFNFITYNTLFSEDSLKVNVAFEVKERWYLWPAPIFELQDRNLNSWWQHRDLFRINYGMFVTLYNVGGLNQTLMLNFRKGYTELYGFNYSMPYLNKKQTVGLNSSFYMTRNNEIAYRTVDNKLQFNRSYTQYMQTNLEAKLGLIYRKGLYNKHIVEMLYCSSSVADTIRKLNSSYYGYNTGNVTYLSFQYRFKRDFRDSKVFPLRGYYYECLLEKDGLNLLKAENVDNFMISAVAKNYWNPFNRLFVGTAVRLRYKTLGSNAYYFNKALGYNDFVRGYEYYVIDGQTFGMIKTNVNFQLIKPRVAKVPIKRLDKFNKIPYAFYLSAHCDAAFVQDKIYYRNNPLANTWLGGAGVGMSFVTYYDHVIRVEASVNKMKQKGIFLHLTAPL